MVNANKIATPNPAAVNIILNDSEMEVILNQLVELAHEKGYCATNINTAIMATWKKKYPTNTEITENPLTDEEVALCERAKKFLKHYSSDICKMYKIPEYNAETQLIKYYATICSVLITYHQGEQLTMLPMNETMNKYFKKYDFTVGWSLPVIGDFIFEKLRYGASEFPEIPKTLGFFSESKLDYLYEYLTFKQEHIDCHSKYYRWGLALVWVINKYF